MPPPPPARQSQPVTANFLCNHGNCAPSACVEDSDLVEEDPFSQVFAAEKKCEVKRSSMPKFRPSAPVFATATPSTSVPVPVVSPTSIPAAPTVPTTVVTLSVPVVTTIPASPEIIADCATPVVPPVPVAVVPPVPTAASIVSSASVMPATTTPIVSPASSAASATTVTLTPSATAATAPPNPIVKPMPVQIMSVHISDASPAARKSFIEKVEVLHVEATSIEEAASIVVTNAADQSNQITQSASAHKPAYSLPLHEINIKIGGGLSHSQCQHQHHHDCHSCLPHNKPETNSHATYPLQQRPPITVILPPVLKYPNKRSGSPTNKSPPHPLAPGTRPHDVVIVETQRSPYKSAPWDDEKCLTGDGQNFKPPGDVRLEAWLGSYIPFRTLRTLLEYYTLLDTSFLLIQT